MENMDFTGFRRVVKCLILFHNLLELRYVV